LSRDVEFLARLQKSSVKFVAVDMPEANELTVHILAAVAQHERQRISERIKAALAEAKKRGKKLGPQPAGVAAIIKHGKRGRALGVAAIKSKADEFARNLRPFIETAEREITDRGEDVTLAALAEALNGASLPTQRQGARWTPAGIARVLRRLER
jgi:DNA invertase Pin-like site-specific DNA recombinase